MNQRGEALTVVVALIFAISSALAFKWNREDAKQCESVAGETQDQKELRERVNACPRDNEEV